MPHTTHPTPRRLAATTLARMAESFPDLHPAGPKSGSKTNPNTDPIPHNYPPRDAALATAITRTATRRWLTITYLLDRVSKKPTATMEPTLQGILIAAAAQLLFLDRSPTHAVVNDSVNLARKLVRPGAAPLTNAILRRLTTLIQTTTTTPTDQPWHPAPDLLPLDTGTLQLAPDTLPDNADLPNFLAIATSHPAPLITRWLNTYGRIRTTQIALHGTRTPPTIIALEPDYDITTNENLTPHNLPNHALWTGRKNQLAPFLDAHPDRRVQDPAAALAVRATEHLRPRLILDYCAGKGTKTLQAAALHRDATVLCTDTDPTRLTALQRAVNNNPRITALPLPELEKHLAALPPHQKPDLLILDVPCSNTAVLARRPEARYRFNPTTLNALTTLQQKILTRTLPLLAPNAHLLYSTCSLEPEENQQQTHHLTQHLTQHQNLTLLSDSQTTPTGQNQSHQDGAYHALLQLPSP